METRAFDALALTRRASLVTLGTAGLATLATLLPTVNVDARKRKKKRSKGNANELCKKQVGQCTTALAPTCEGEDICPELVACCSFLGTCNVNGFLVCVVEASQQT